MATLEKTAKIHCLLGGAGTGKTSRLMGLLDDAIRRLELHPHEVLFASFTRAARQEASERAARLWPGYTPAQLQKEHYFRTVHSFALKQLAIEKHRLITPGKDFDQWLRDVGVANEPDAFTIWDTSRQRLLPLSAHPADMQTIERYEKAKRGDGKLDFTDILLKFSGWVVPTDGGPARAGWPDGEVAETVRVAFFDEAQDNSALVDACCKRIAESVEEVFVAGDENQSVYGFGGSDPAHLLAWSEQADELESQPRSYRCPPPVMELGERVLHNTTGHTIRHIEPADKPGLVIWKSDLKLPETIAPDENAMVLARCAFSLSRYKEQLANALIPFGTVGTEPSAVNYAAAAALMLHRGEAIAGEWFTHLIEAVPSKGNLVHGAKKAWEDKAWECVTAEDLPELGAKEPLITAIRTGVFGEILPKSSHFLKVARKHGIELALKPTIRLGTIHSSKGLEAATVIVCTESCRTVNESYSAGGLQRDEEFRLIYVAVTRASSKLIIDDVSCQYKLAGLEKNA